MAKEVPPLKAKFMTSLSRLLQDSGIEFLGVPPLPSFSELQRKTGVLQQSWSKYYNLTRTDKPELISLHRIATYLRGPKSLTRTTYNSDHLLLVPDRQLTADELLEIEKLSNMKLQEQLQSLVKAIKDGRNPHTVLACLNSKANPTVAYRWLVATKSTPMMFLNKCCTYKTMSSQEIVDVFNSIKNDFKSAFVSCLTANELGNCINQNTIAETIKPDIIKSFQKFDKEDIGRELINDLLETLGYPLYLDKDDDLDG